MLILEMIDPLDIGIAAEVPSLLCEKTAPPVVRGSVASRRRAPGFRSFCPPDVLEHRPGHSKCTAHHPVLTLWMCKLRPATSSSPGPLPALPGTAIHTLRPLPSLSQASAALLPRSSRS